jgi:hypothetical protein
MSPRSCPRFDKCNAPICPLDSSWRKRVLLHDDPTCFYLLESVKKGAKANFMAPGWGWLYEAMVEATPAISARWGRIKNKLSDAAKTGSRMKREFRLETDHA